MISVYDGVFAGQSNDIIFPAGPSSPLPEAAGSSAIRRKADAPAPQNFAGG